MFVIVAPAVDNPDKNALLVIGTGFASFGVLNESCIKLKPGLPTSACKFLNVVILSERVFNNFLSVLDAPVGNEKPPILSAILGATTFLLCVNISFINPALATLLRLAFLNVLANVPAFCTAPNILPEDKSFTIPVPASIIPP